MTHPPEDIHPEARGRGSLGGWGPVAAIVGALLLVRVVTIVATIRSGAADPGTILGGDPQRYVEILTAPGVPYRDVPVEFPPLTLGLLALLPRQTSTVTVVSLAASQLLLEFATALVLAWAWGKRTALAFLLLGTPIALLFPFPYFRIDLLSVFLAVTGMALLRQGRERPGGIVLAVAVFAKVWPVVLGPALLVRRQWRGLALWVATGVIGVATWVAWVGFEGVRQVTTYRGATGWQIESIPGSWFHMLDPTSSAIEQGAMRTAVDATGGARAAMTLGAIAVVAVAWWLASRVPHEKLALAAESYAPLVAISGLIVFSPIISPQYVLWLLPFAAIAAARGDLWVGGLTLATGALSSLQLQVNEALIEGRWWALTSLTLRNALLIGIGALCTARLVHLARRPPARHADEESPLSTR